jgi:hypothetical protein
VRSNAPPAFTTVVWRGATQIVGKGSGPSIDVQAVRDSRNPDESGVFWVEIRRPGATVSWVISNPIYVRSAGESPAAPVPAPAVASAPLFDGHTASGWSVEHDAMSVAVVEVSSRLGGSELRVRYGLAGGVRAQQYAALTHLTPGGVGSFDRLTFTARAEHPMRVSVQLRADDGSGTAWRWQRSVYLDAGAREHTVRFDDLVPIGPAPTWAPDRAHVVDILFVVDTANTKPGSSGRFWITTAALQR